MPHLPAEDRTLQTSAERNQDDMTQALAFLPALHRTWVTGHLREARLVCSTKNPVSQGDCR